MKYANTLILMMLVAALSGVGFYLAGCGDFNTPDGGSEVAKTGFIIYTGEQQVYNGDSLFDICPDVYDGTTFVAYSYQAWGEDKEIWADFEFIFKPNPGLDCGCDPYYAIVDECKLEIPGLFYEEERHDCGPWEIYLDGVKESDLTIFRHVWGYSWLEYYVVGMGSPYGNSFAYTAYFTIWAKSIDGTEQEAKTYAMILVFPEGGECEESLIPPPAWAGP